MPSAKEIALAENAVRDLNRLVEASERLVRELQSGASLDALAEINGTPEMIRVAQERARIAILSTQNLTGVVKTYADSIEKRYGIGRHPQSDHRDRPEAGHG